MTECERIIEQGFLPKSFFEEEVQCGFVVSKTRKKIWAVELDLLYQFKFFCEKNNLKWFLIGGSLLGAVRHCGIIPWDDDIDVGMPRNDYNRFIQIAANHFREPYFLQTPYTDPGYAYSYIKLRNSNTSCIVPMFKYQGFNHGIFLDIFPYDNWDENDSDKRFAQINKLAYDNSTYMRIKNPYLDKQNLERVNKWPGRNPIDIYEEIQNLASYSKDRETGKVAKVVFARNLKNGIHNIDDYRTTLLVKFNNLMVRIPSGYNNILKIYFGEDYMEIPPVEKRMAHEEAFFDPDKSYKYYLEGIV